MKISIKYSLLLFILLSISSCTKFYAVLIEESGLVTIDKNLTDSFVDNKEKIETIGLESKTHYTGNLQNNDYLKIVSAYNSAQKLNNDLLNKVKAKIAKGEEVSKSDYDDDFSAINESIESLESARNTIAGMGGLDLKPLIKPITDILKDLGKSFLLKKYSEIYYNLYQVNDIDKIVTENK